MATHDWIQLFVTLIYVHLLMLFGSTVIVPAITQRFRPATTPRPNIQRPPRRQNIQQPPQPQPQQLTLVPPTEIVSVPPTEPNALRKIERLQKEVDRLAEKALESHILKAKNDRLTRELDKSQRSEEQLRRHLERAREDLIGLEAKIERTQLLQHRLTAAQTARDTAEAKAQEAIEDAREAYRTLTLASDTQKAQDFKIKRLELTEKGLQIESDEAWTAAHAAQKRSSELARDLDVSQRAVRNTEQKLDDTKKSLEHLEVEAQALRERPQTKISTANGRQLDEMRGRLIIMERHNQSQAKRIEELEAELKRLGKKPAPLDLGPNSNSPPVAGHGLGLSGIPQPGAPPEVSKETQEYWESRRRICPNNPSHLWYDEPTCPGCSMPSLPSSEEL